MSSFNRLACSDLACHYGSLFSSKVPGMDGGEPLRKVFNDGFGVQPHTLNRAITLFLTTLSPWPQLISLPLKTWMSLPLTGL